MVNETEIDWFEQADLLGRTKFWAAPDSFELLSAEARGKIHGSKLFTDGAFGARTAAIELHYVGQSGNRGILLYSDEQLQALVKECAALSPAIAIHAIGDRAIEQTITVLERVGSDALFQETRIEHAQLITQAQATRAKNLGAKLSMQPNFNSDSSEYADRLPADCLRANNPFRMLIDDVGFEPGVDLVFGSDGMPHGIEHAFKEVDEPPFEVQRLSREELLSGYTRSSQKGH